MLKIRSGTSSCAAEPTEPGRTPEIGVVGWWGGGGCDFALQSGCQRTAQHTENQTGLTGQDLVRLLPAESGSDG